VNESFSFGDLVHIIYEQTPIALGLWMGSETLGKNREAFAKIFQIDRGEIIYFEKDDIYSFRLASNAKSNDYDEKRK
jgi:hypothetical protein